MTTKATWWVYVFSPQAFVAVEVERLKKYLEVNDIKLKEFVPNSSNPTRGYLLLPEDVNKLLSSDLYDTPE